MEEGQNGSLGFANASYYILNLKRNERNELTYKIGRDLENELMIARGKGE